MIGSPDPAWANGGDTSEISYGGAPAPAADENPNVIVSVHGPGATFTLRSRKLPATVAVCCDVVVVPENVHGAVVLGGAVGLVVVLVEVVEVVVVDRRVVDVEPAVDPPPELPQAPRSTTAPRTTTTLPTRVRLSLM